jgi:hypothetical protein
MISDHPAGFRFGRRWEAVAILCDFLVCKGLCRLAKLVFQLHAAVNLSDPVENDPVVHAESTLDFKDVVHFVPDDDPALTHHAIFADDAIVPLVENLEGRPLGDEDGVI